MASYDNTIKHENGEYFLYCSSIVFPTKAREHLVSVPGWSFDGRTFAFVDSKDVLQLSSSRGKVRVNLVSIASDSIFVRVPDISADRGFETFQIPFERLF